MVATLGHKNSALGQMHKVHNWEYADATARLAATGFVAGDLKKLALQLDDSSLWVLTATTPTWVRLSAKVAADISDFHTAVRTNRLDQMAAPTAAVGLNSQKITSLATPTVGTDAATKQYVDDNTGTGGTQVLYASAGWQGQVTNDLTETSLYLPANSVGSNVLPLNDLAAGDLLVIELTGYWACNNASDLTLRIREQYGATDNILASKAIALASGHTTYADGWTLRLIGTAELVLGDIAISWHGTLLIVDGTPSMYQFMAGTVRATQETLPAPADYVLDVTAQWSVAGADNDFACKTVVITRTPYTA